MSKNMPEMSEERSNAMTFNTPLPLSGRDPDSVPFEERMAELEEAKRDPVKAIRAQRERRNREQLERDREKLKGQNGNGVATLSLREALKAIAEAQRPPKPTPLWGPDPFANLPEGLEPDPAVLKGWEEDQAAIAMWRKQNREDLEKVRAQDRAKRLRSILLGLDDLMRRYPPEEAGAALARMAGEGRALEAVGECITWLQQTLQEAEREQARMQDAE